MPLSLKRLKKTDWMARGRELFGDDMLDWEFVCPVCGHVQKASDFRQYKDRGAQPDDARFNCIGRFMEKCRDAFGGKGPGPCNYTSGGLFRVSPVVVEDEEGREFVSFAFNEEAA